MKSLLYFLLVTAPLFAHANDGYLPEIKVTPLLQSNQTAAGQPIKYSESKNPEVTALKVIIPPGADTGWHRHPFPCYGYILKGDLTVEFVGGRKNQLHAGEALIEAVNLPHRGINHGKTPVELIMFVTGETKKPFSVKESIPAR